MRTNRKCIRDDKDIKFVYANENDMMLNIVCSKEKTRQQKYFTVENNA